MKVMDTLFFKKVLILGYCNGLLTLGEIGTGTGQMGYMILSESFHITPQHVQGWEHIVPHCSCPSPGACHGSAQYE